jgi:class I fructose-bisphosphate aldolase
MSRVCEVLSWYGRDNPGTLTNLARMLNHGRLAGSGKMVILPVDQGFEHGPARSFAPNPPAYDPHYHYKLVIKSGCNAYAAPLSFLEAGAREFAGEVPLILKVNDHDVYTMRVQSPCAYAHRSHTACGPVVLQWPACHHLLRWPDRRGCRGIYRGPGDS